jgi:murein DD-endopeptidase MepM/ murein hydrolase activator NlpD
MKNPVPGYKITTPYGKPGRLWKTGYHVGADFAAPSGKPVVAVKDGKVLEAKNGTSWGSAYGIAVVIDHGDGIRAIYAHLSKSLVKAGDVVVEGEQIGEIGSTGNSTGPHLHLETRVSPWRYNNKDVDPACILEGAAKTSFKAKLTANKEDKRTVTGSAPEVKPKKKKKAADTSKPKKKKK